jgi:hypothetical protein
MGNGRENSSFLRQGDEHLATDMREWENRTEWIGVWIGRVGLML